MYSDKDKKKLIVKDVGCHAERHILEKLNDYKKSILICVGICIGH